MKILYRISDGGYKKNKPHYVTKRDCFTHFIKIFKGYDIYVFADNISQETFEFLINYISPEKIFQTSLNNGHSFIYTLQFAVTHFNDEEKVYFAEDDYIYKEEAPKIIEEGLNIADYSSGYDHPDKYINSNNGGPNPFISNGGELTRVVITNSSHWKFTNSCCMTFASRIKTLKEDTQIFKNHCVTGYPYDFKIFGNLRKKGRKLASCIPAVSTHGETEWLSKFIDWEQIMNNNK
jgi:hypothetical protein